MRRNSTPNVTTNLKPAWLRVCCCLALAVNMFGASAFADEPVDFNEHIRPIFTKHCTACHGGVKMEGDVSFVTPETVLPPDGWAIEPGDPDASLLMDLVLSDDPDERMPKPEHGTKLTEQEIDLLKRWIKQGAKWSGHWAYEKPVAPEVPKLAKSDWPIQTLDKFVLARLQQEKIQPNGDAKPERWLRRVTLDLIGLPPTLEERKAFLTDVQDQGEAAYQRVVERLLNSPAYGERWASVWLDQVRYADSKGLGADNRRNVWKYRDWVVNAFNKDMPYSDFTISQIAGDLLPEATIDDLVATAGQRLTQTNEEGGTDDEEFRIAAVLDRVSTTWQTWQGVTFGCTQCHSHPYDPFKHEEYYKFAAFFNNTSDCDLGNDWPVLQAPVDAKNNEKAVELDRQIESTTDELWRHEYELLNDDAAWLPITKMTAKTSNDTKVAVEQKETHAQYHTVDTVSSGTSFTLETELPKAAEQITAIRFTALPLDPKKARSDSEWGFVLSRFEAHWVLPGEKEPQPIAIARGIIDEPTPYHNPQESLNAKSQGGFSAFSRIHHPRSAAFILKEPTAVAEGAKLQITLGHRVQILSAFPLVARRGHIAVSQDQRFTAALTDAAILQKRSDLAALTRKRNGIRSTSIPVLRERPKHLARPSHVFTRGLFLTKGDEVTAGTPASMPPLPEGVPVNRLAMAQWLVSADNPLTARVAVNRVWAQLFGIGIVATEEDFGTSGEKPSHPQLLDYLALRFQNEQGYRFKSMIQEMVLSRTYRQSAVIRREMLQRDPQNRLLARGPKHRLSAETIRDQALAVAGLLSHKVGGPPVRPSIPDGVWRPFAGDKWETPKVGDPNRYRRSVYTYLKRSIPYPMFASFDAPSREFCAPRRLRSNTPLAGLVTLNHLTFAECSAALANRMKAASDQPREQLRHGFLLVTSREPADDELDDLLALKKTYQPEKESAALTAVATVLLNLDEVLCK